MSDTRLAIIRNSTGFICFIGEDGESTAALLLRFGQHLEETTVGYMGIELDRDWADRKLTGDFRAYYDSDPAPDWNGFYVQTVSVAEAARNAAYLAEVPAWLGRWPECMN